MRLIPVSLRGFGVLVAALLLLSALPAGLVAAAPVVSNCNDSGTGSLRAAIAAAVAGDTITFGVNCPSGSGTQITLASPLTIAQNNLTVDATGHTIVVDGNNQVTDFTVTGGTAAQPVTLNGLTIQHGNAFNINGNGAGGGIYNTGTLTVKNGILTANTASGFVAGDGGGIYNAGTLTVTNSTFSANFSRNGAGGGIANDAVGSVLTVTNSTFSSNRATGGGGIYNTQSATVTNSTFSDNTVSGINGVGGAGISTSGTLTLTNSIVSGNSLITPPNNNTPGGGIYNAGTLTAVNTLIAGNDAPTSPDVSGAFAPNSKNNLLGNASGSTGISDGDGNHNIVGHPAVLGSLGNYGGPTQTVPLLAGSPAIDHGDDATCQNTAGIAPVAGKDQRGITRPQGPHCDIGAFEAMTTTGPPPAPTNLHVTGATNNAVSWAWTETDPSAPLAFTVDGAHLYSLAAGTTTYTLYGIAYGSYGCMSIAAYNSSGASPYTPYACSYVVPYTPYIPHFTSATTSTVNFAWSDYDALSYEAAFDGTTTHLLGVNATGYSAPTAAGYYACISVVAYNVSYASPYSPYTCAYALPLTPSSLHVTGHTTTTVSFAWTDHDPYSGIGATTGGPLFALAAGTTSYMVTGLASGQYGCLDLAAYNASGASGYTGYVCGQAG